MNRILKISLSLLFASIFIVGCEEDDEFTTIDLNTSIKRSVGIVIPDSTQTDYSQDLLIDPISNEELRQYRNQLESLTINKISFKIIDFNGSPEAAFEGTIQFEGSSVVLELPRTKLRETADNEVVTTLQVTNELLNEVSTLFSGLNPVKATTHGTIYNGPADFELEISVGVKAEVKIVP